MIIRIIIINCLESNIRSSKGESLKKERKKERERFDKRNLMLIFRTILFPCIIENYD